MDNFDFSLLEDKELVILEYVNREEPPKKTFLDKIKCFFSKKYQEKFKPKGKFYIPDGEVIVHEDKIFMNEKTAKSVIKAIEMEQGKV